MKLVLIIDKYVEDSMKKLSITKEDIEKRMYEVFSYIPEDYDFIDTTINKNNKIYRIQFGVCEINEDSIKIECLLLKDPEEKYEGPTIREYHEKTKKEKAVR
ncbi:MAG: hypothetical protein ACPLW7_01460 [Minisyncoccia bacterium]